MPAKNVKISIAMATYNGEAYVEQQLESILRQTRLPDELIVSDDCSSDRTIELVKRVTRRSPFPVRIIQNARNVGMNGNYEIAVREAAGDIIILSDWDDYWLPERVSETASAFAESEDVVLVYCDAELTDRDLRPTGITLFGLRPQLRVTTEVRCTEALAGAILVQGATIALRRDLKPFVLPFPHHCALDRWLSLIASAVGEIRSIDRPLIYYRRHGNNWAPLESEGTLKRRWIRASNSEVYAYRVCRWEEVHRRLEEIRAGGFSAPSGKRFDDFVNESGSFLGFARRREKMKGRPRVGRILEALTSLARGDYHRYADGVRSCVLDVAAR